MSYRHCLRPTLYSLTHYSLTHYSLLTIRYSLFIVVTHSLQSSVGAV